MRRTWAFGLILLAVPAFAQLGENPDEKTPPEQRGRFQQLQEKALQLMNATQQLGNWEDNAAAISGAMDRMFERNHWDSESDMFSLEMIHEVGAIPPWDPQARMEKLTEMVGDRYLLSEDQLADMQQRFIQLNVELFSKHSDRIMEYAMDAIQTRAAGEPFTPEQIARWVELAEPVFNDARDSIHGEARKFMKNLDPEQQELLERDLQAADRRMGDMQQLSQKWKRGEWKAGDWGLEDDPIQMQGRPGEPQGGGGSAEPGGAGGVAAPGGGKAAEAGAPAGGGKNGAQTQPGPKAGTPKEPDDEWARYVREFIRKYKLNDEQQQRAWLIYRDAKERDDVFQRRFDRQLETARGRAGAEAEPAQAAIREQTEKHTQERDRLFGQMKRRLDRLPTRAQKKEAEPVASGPAAEAGKPAGKATP
jgi:hypothetical protein